MKAFQQALEKARLFVELHYIEAQHMSPVELAQAAGVSLAELELAIEELLHERHYARKVSIHDND